MHSLFCSTVNDAGILTCGGTGSSVTLNTRVHVHPQQPLFTNTTPERSRFITDSPAASQPFSQQLEFLSHPLLNSVKTRFQ